MNEFDGIDRELEAAFAQRPTALSRPSLRDVKQRARRHQRQRRAAVLSACALAGVGGVTALAQRSPGSATNAREGLDGGNASTTYPTATTIYCAAVDSTVRDSTTTSLAPASTLPAISEYTLTSGDNPSHVAEMFGITLDELNAANADIAGYTTFFVGLKIRIPSPRAVSETTTTTQTVAPTSTIYGTPCPPLPAEGFRCTGFQIEPGDGWAYFEYCEAINFPISLDSTTTSIAEPEITATTCVELPIMTLPPPATTTTIVRAC